MAKWTDIVFLLYFASHIPITLLIDAQCALPKWLYPETDIVVFHARTFKDPFIINPPGWFLSFIICELLFQFPFFFVAVYAFWKGGCRWIRIPAVVYGSHVATTVIPIIYHIMVTDFTVLSESSGVLKSAGYSGPETLSERLILSSFYAPYLFVPILLVYTMLTSPDYAPLKSKFN